MIWSFSNWTVISSERDPTVETRKFTALKCLAMTGLV